MEDDYQRQLEELIERSQVTGASFAYWDGAKLHAAAAGQRNSVTGDPLTADTIMLIGSITKVFTATLVMQLVDDGLIDLADPVIRHLPDLRLRDQDALTRITCGMLLNHTSGIDGELLPDHGPDQERIADAITRFADLGQLHPPGAGPSYCNAGCVIAGYLAQQLRGQSWYALIASRVFQPLELNHALADLTDLPKFRCSVGDLSGLAPGKLVQTTRPFLPLSFAPAGATLMLSATDLVNFARALTNDGIGPNGARVLSAASARRMTRPTADVIEPAGTRWGLGWALHPGGVVCHNGGGPGTFASLYAHPESGRVVTLLTNSDTGYNAAKVALAPIVESWTGNVESWTGAVAAPPSPTTTGDLDPQLYAGVFENVMTRLEVSPREGGLILRMAWKEQVYDNTAADTQSAIALTPLGGRAFQGEAGAGFPPMVFRFGDADAAGRMHVLAFQSRVYVRTDPASERAGRGR